MIRSSDTKIITVTTAPVTEVDTNQDPIPSIEFVVTLPANASDDVTIAYATTDGSASAGKDYTATSGALNLESGASADTKTVTVETKPDSLFEGIEKFNLTLRLVSAPDDVTLEKRSVSGTINDNDALTVSVEAVQDAVVEGSVATFQVTLAKTGTTTHGGQQCAGAGRLQAQRTGQ